MLHFCEVYRGRKAVFDLGNQYQDQVVISVLKNQIKPFWTELWLSECAMRKRAWIVSAGHSAERDWFQQLLESKFLYLINV